MMFEGIDTPTTMAGIQDEQQQWAHHNFPSSSNNILVPVLGVAEEAGELAHAVLKMNQGIRGTEATHRSEVRDAVGDVTIYMMDLCNQLGLEIAQCVIDAWEEVRARDWVKYPTNGVSV